MKKSCFVLESNTHLRVSRPTLIMVSYEPAGLETAVGAHIILGRKIWGGLKEVQLSQ